MSVQPSFAVLLFKEAQETLGDAIKPFQISGPFGVFIPCRSVDTTGQLCLLLIDTQRVGGTDLSVEIQIPYSMIKLVIATEREEHVGFIAH